MSSDYKVTFGNENTTLFTVTDVDESGKTLVVKCDISEDVEKNSEIDLQIGENDLTARGLSTGVPINASSSAINLTNNKVLKQVYATFVNVATITASVAPGTSTELLRFTVTPKSGEVINLSNMDITLTDALDTTSAEAMNIYDVTAMVLILMLMLKKM